MFNKSYFFKILQLLILIFYSIVFIFFPTKIPILLLRILGVIIIPFIIMTYIGILILQNDKKIEKAEKKLNELEKQKSDMEKQISEFEK